MEKSPGSFKFPTIKELNMNAPFINISEEELSSLANVDLMNREDFLIPTVNTVGQLYKLMHSAYSNNKRLIRSERQIYLRLMARIISVYIRNQPNMSSIVQRNNTVESFFLAYQGVHEKIGNILFVSDWISKDKRSGSYKLFVNFMKKFALCYVKNNYLYPILINARYDTTYKLISSHKLLIDNLTNMHLDKNQHITYCVREVSRRYEQGELFIDMIFRPVYIN